MFQDFGFQQWAYIAIEFVIFIVLPMVALRRLSRRFIRCPQCGGRIKRQAKVCGFCGHTRS
jgi:hypothetical protein